MRRLQFVVVVANQALVFWRLRPFSRERSVLTAGEVGCTGRENRGIRLIQGQ